MKVAIVMVALVILFKLPMVNWLEATQEEKQMVVDVVGEFFIKNIDPTCKKVEIKVYDGKDGFAYIGAVCLDKVPSVDPGKIVAMEVSDG